MTSWLGVLIAVALGAYAVVSRRAAALAVSAPMVMVSVGLALGPLGLDLISLTKDPGLVRVLLESALVLVLFTDAMSVEFRSLRRENVVPLRLLAIGFPLTIGFGWLAGWALLPGLSVWELALLGTILAPTDAALGQPAITDRRVPVLVRQGLNVESGLNDGMALPFFTLFLAAAVEVTQKVETAGPVEVFFQALLLTAALGAAVGWLGGRALAWASAKDWVTPAWRHILVVVIAGGAYALAVAVEGSGFIGAWVAGLAFGTALRTAQADDRQLRRRSEFAEELGVLLTTLSFLTFGAVLLGPALAELSWRPAVYALLSLTVVRILPVAIGLHGTGLRPPTVAYIGWFGPRGLASIVLGLMALEEDIPHGGLLAAAVAVTVGISVYAHGATAGPLAARYGSWYSAAATRNPGLREHSVGASRVEETTS